MIMVFTYCFEKWWRPVLFFIITTLLFVLSEFIRLPEIQDYVFLLFVIGLLGLVISSVYQLVRKRWQFAIFTILITTVSMVGFWNYLFLMLLGMESHDTYADRLKIPADIEINEPLDQTEQKNIADTDFYLYYSFQPGLYQYAFWTKRIEKGKIYLKAFEITHNDPLSGDRLKERSFIQVYNPSDSLVKFQMDKGPSDLGSPFTIYEGDWGKPYAARFEVWFIPESGGQERKLVEKNYKIEGWQR